MTSPLQEFRNQNVERWSVLQDIPPWEVETILGWLRNIFIHLNTSGLTNREQFNYSVVRAIETENRLLVAEDLQISTSSWPAMRASLEELIGQGQARNVILFIECVVKYVRESSQGVLYYRHVLSSDTVLSYLESSLERGSRWSVVFDRQADAGLLERVSPEITEIAKGLDIDYLTKAWNEAFAVSPKPDKAIANAQLAIEALASAKGLTKVKTSVYGNVLGDIRSNPTKYTSAARDAYELANKLSQDPKNPVDFNEVFSNWFWTGLDLIQKTHPARHASEDTKDFVLSPEAGKQATLIATIICELISGGYFTKK